MTFLKKMVALCSTIALLSGSTVANAYENNAGSGYEETTVASSKMIGVGLFTAVALTAALIAVVNDCGNRGTSNHTHTHAH